MSHRFTALSLGTLALGALLLAAPSAGAQTAQPGATAAPTTAPAPATRSRTAKPTEGTARQPTPGQNAARDRQRQCGAEWKQAKAAGKVAAGMKWPQYWSQCNTRLKQQKA